MQHLITGMSGRLSAAWARRREFAKRLQEDDRGSITVENALWIVFWFTVATTVGAIFYNVILAKAHDFHL